MKNNLSHTEVALPLHRQKIRKGKKIGLGIRF